MSAQHHGSGGGREDFREALRWESPAERFAKATVAFSDADIEVVATAVAGGIGATSSAAPRAATAPGWTSTASRHASTSCSHRPGLVQARHDASEHDEHAEWERPTPGQWYWHETDGGRRAVQITRIDVGAKGMEPEATSERQTALSLAAPVSGDSCLRRPQWLRGARGDVGQDGAVVGSGVVAALGGLIGDRAGVVVECGGGVDAGDQGVADEDVINQLGPAPVGT